MGVENAVTLQHDRGYAVLPDGTRIIATRKRVRRTASEVAVHEARHAVTEELAGRTYVLYVTRVPGEGYLGLTVFADVPSAAAMAAPKALGSGGTGGDEEQLVAAGHSIASAESDARRILSGAEAEIMVMEVAAALDRSGTLSGQDVRTILADVQKGEEVEILIVLPNGNGASRSHHRAKYGRDNITIVDLPKIYSEQDWAPILNN